MKKLFWGFFFICLNFNLTFNGHQLNILPDFVGYILLIRGMGELAAESAFFERARPFAAGMAVYAAILWIGALLGVTSDGWIASLLELATTVLALYISWLLIRGVLEMEERKAADWGGKPLLGRWKLLLCVQIVSRLLGLMADLANLGVIFTLVAAVSIVGMVCLILYLLAWYRVWNAYEADDGEEPTGAAETE